MRLLRWLAALGTAVGMTVATAPPAAATHLAGVTVTQVESQGTSVTLQFDVSFNPNNSGGEFTWLTGDGREALMRDGVTGGSYDGDATGTGTFGGAAVPGAGRSYSWARTSPAAGVSRTRVTYAYAAPGTYTVRWEACCPTHSGVLTVNATGSSVADCTVDGADPHNRITYTPAITSPLIPQRVEFDLDVVMVCTGSAPAAGTYDLNVKGMTSETCTFGQSDDAHVTGTKPSSSEVVAATDGRWNHHREGIHLFGYPDPSRPQQSGEFYLAGSSTRYELNLWLDIPVTAAVCAGSGGQLSWGHATIRT